MKSGASFTTKSIPTINCGFQSYDQGAKNNLTPELTFKVFHRWQPNNCSRLRATEIGKKSGDLIESPLVKSLYDSRDYLRLRRASPRTPISPRMGVVGSGTLEVRTPKLAPLASVSKVAWPLALA